LSGDVKDTVAVGWDAGIGRGGDDLAAALRRMGTAFEPIRPVPPITTIFMVRHIVGWEPAPFEAGQDAGVRRIVAEQDAHLVTLETRGKKSGRRVELWVILPEVADVVTGRRERVGDAQRNVALQRRSILKSRGRKRSRSRAFSAPFACRSLRRSSPSALTTSSICARLTRHPAHARKCSSQRARAAEGRASSR
jgi:hypothetical protein